MPITTYALLAAAIVAEVIGTTALARTDGFTRLVPSLITLVSYAAAFYFLSHTLRVLPVGMIYAIWSGLGIVLIAAVAWILFGQRLDPPALIGMAMIIAGVMVVNLFSETLPH